MKFSSREDIEAPIDTVFEMLSDFEGFERSALRRGAEVQRMDDLTEPGVGMMWEAKFDMRGKRREIQIVSALYDRPSDMSFEVTSPGMAGTFDVELIALSRQRTRMNVALELRPQNLSARLLVQSLKLAKSTLTKRFKLRVAEYTRDMEDRYRRTA
jgi:hypothetical protein